MTGVPYMVDRECRVENDPGAMLEILLSYSDSRRTELRPVKVLLSIQLIWLLRSMLKHKYNRLTNESKHNAYYWLFLTINVTNYIKVKA